MRLVKTSLASATLFCLLLVVTFSYVNSSGRCLNNTEESQAKRYLHFEGNYLNLTLEVSRRPTHLLTTHIFKIVLQELLEYQNVEIVQTDDDFNVESTFTRLSGNKDTVRLIPKAMMNLEVWVPPQEDTTLFTDRYHVKECGSVGPPGRFGWFIPIQLANRLPTSFRNERKMSYRDIHWSSFLNESWAGLFDINENYLKFVLQNTIDSQTKEYFCFNTVCSHGMYIPEQCKYGKCALLLTSYYNETKFVVDQINEMRLYVKVVWLGSNLKNVFDYLTAHYLQNIKSSQSILILSRSPSEIIFDETNFVSVSFQSCSFGLNRIGCKYEPNRLVKVSWSLLEKIASPAYRALHELSFKKNNYKDLLERYNNEPNKSIEMIACDWLKDNSNFTKNWNYYHQEKTKLTIGGIFPLSGHTGVSYTARGIYTAANMAMDAINENDNILKNYELEILGADGQCKADTVMRKFIDFLQYENLVGILGPACSETVEPLAGVSKNYKILVISYSAEGASLSDRTKYPYFFRTIGENKHYNPVYLELFKKLGWSQIASLTEDGQKYTEYISHLQTLLDTNGITFISNAKFPRERTQQHALTKYLEDLKRKRARIVIADVYDDVARIVMCEAYKLNMTARHGYIWFLPLWLSSSWYNTTYYNRIQDEKVNCTVEMMFEAINGHLSLTHAYFAPNDSLMQENVTVGEWREKYESKCKNPNGGNYYSHFAGYAYDAVWTFALALDELIKQDPVAISTLHSTNTTQRLVNIVEATDFHGVSGRIKFLGGPSRHSVINVVQWLNRKTRIVGSFYPNISVESADIIGGKLYLNESAIVWLTPDGRKPEDGREPPQKCVLEGLAETLDVSCEIAIIIANVIIFGIIGILLTIAIIRLKKGYDQKVMVTQQYMRSLGIDLLNTNQMTLDKWEIQRDKIVINRKIGEGAFGTVYGGEAYFDDKGWVAVAVKALKKGSTTEEKLDFLSEAEVMKRFEHKNIVKLLGVCTQMEPIYTVMEFMLYGDLKTFLLARRHLVKEKLSEESEEISSKKLTSMALDVARALSYLAQMKFVHRDVACRNCLLTAQKMVKLGDFGMTRRMYENDYYKFNRKGMLPVRWMAPESLALGVFTPSSDVWSFGVLLYEIITFGSFPFQAMSNFEVLEHVKNGNVLTIPPGVKPQLEGLIKSCWNSDYKRRPHASEIVEFLANNPRLLTPCLDVPIASVQRDDVEDDFTVPPFTEQFRKCSVAINPPLNEVSLEANAHPPYTSQSGKTSCQVPSSSCLMSTDIMIPKSCLNDLATFDSEIDNCFSIDEVDNIPLEHNHASEPLLRHHLNPSITPNSPSQYKTENEHNKYVTLQRQISDDDYLHSDAFGVYQTVTSV